MELISDHSCPPGYKQTVVGVIPDDWNVELLDSVTYRGSGHTPDKAHPEYWGGQIKWISLQDSDRLDNIYIYDTTVTITPAGIANSSAKIHPAGTVVISRDAGVGKSAIMKDDMAVSQHFIAWNCGPSLSNHFLYYWLQANKAEFERIAMGNTIKTIGLPYFKQLVIPLPTKDEQEAIAEVLGDVDALIAALDQLIAKKRAIKQGVMQQLLTGISRLPGFSGKWEMLTLGELEQRGDIKLYRGKVISQKDINRIPGDYPIYSSSIHSNGVFGYYGEYMFDEELITWSVDGGGHFFYRPKHRFSVTNVCGYLRIRKQYLNYRYLAYHLQELHSHKIFDYTLKAHPSVIRSAYNLMLPSMEEQATIATVLSDMDAEIAALEAQREKTHALKQGLMQELLTGKTRLL